MSKNPKQKVTPLGKYTLVRVEPPAITLSKSGLSVPANTDPEQKAQGELLALGKEVKVDVKEKDTVIFGAYAGENLTMNEDGDDVDYKLLHEDDLIAKIE